MEYNKLIEVCSKNLFHKIINNSGHCLYHLLPCNKDISHILRKVDYGLQLLHMEGVHDTRNFVLW